MDSLINISAKERLEVFTETAARINTRPRIIEKDFWVCWILKHLFEQPDFGSHLTFKGGTSLSKAYKIIKRFSEDIDLTISKEFLGIVGADDPANATSRKARDKSLKALVKRAEEFTSGKLRSSLHKQLEQHLPGVWELSVDEKDPQTLLFHYPTVGTDTQVLDEYIKEVVRLEFGIRGDSWPTSNREILPYVSEVFPEQFPSASIAINTLTIERTFWEKITLIHAEHHRPRERESKERISRHYYDVVMLWREGVHVPAIQEPLLLESVVKNKIIYFPSVWASYETAKLGTLRLVPASEWVGILKADYKSMEPMFFEPPPSFDAIINELTQLEAKLNVT